MSMSDNVRDALNLLHEISGRDFDWFAETLVETRAEAQRCLQGILKERLAMWMASIEEEQALGEDRPDAAVYRERAIDLVNRMELEK